MSLAVITEKIDTVMNSPQTTALLLEIESTIQAEEQKRREETAKLRKSVEKPFTPKEASWKKLSGLNPDWKLGLEYMSPFKTMYSSNVSIDQVLKGFIPFKQEQIDRMEETTKRHYLKEVEKGIRATLKACRDGLLDWEYVMFEETFENNKLKLLLDDKPVPKKLLSEEEYLIIENAYVETLLHMLSYKIGLTEEISYPFYINQRYKGDYACVHDLWLRLLTQFDCFYPANLKDVGGNFQGYLKRGGRLTEEEIILYQSFQVCPISFDLSDFSTWDVNMISSRTLGVMNVEDHFALLDVYQYLLLKENLEKIIQYILNFLHLVYRLKEKNEGLVKNSDIESIHLIKNIINRLPEMKTILVRKSA